MRVRTNAGTKKLLNNTVPNEHVFEFLNLGIRPIDFLGNFYMTNTTEMVFGTIDSDKSVSVELKHDDKLPVESNTYIQVKYLFIILFIRTFE